MAYGALQELRARKILVTGGCGFIGSALVRFLTGICGAEVLNLDKLTYAGSLSSVASVAHLTRYRFRRVDICDGPQLTGLIQEFRPDAIVHLAAETHVDRSIDGPAGFIQTNILGTYNLLEGALGYFRTLSGTEQNRFRLLHISTDEVFGDLSHADPPFTEQSQYLPNSPYSASKAASDHLVRAWGRTYGLPVVISNCSNNYGPYQSPEKMIPTMILSALHGRQLPVYANGENIRDWLYVDDHVSALALLATQGRPGESYLIGGQAETRNIDLVQNICAIMDEIRKDCATTPHHKLICFVPDRPGHDFRYAMDAEKIRSELGWRPAESFTSGLRKTIQWYIDNELWWRERLSASQFGQRLGLGTHAKPVTRETPQGAEIG